MLTVEQVKINDGPVLSGKKVGLNARDRYGLNAFDEDGKKVNITLETSIVTSSYVLGLLSPSVIKLGVDQFWENYIFNAPPNVMATIRENIAYAANKGSSLTN